MCLDFKEWLLLGEMAYVSKNPIYLDKYDISYLKQFPLYFWSKALKLRYNDFLVKGIEAFKNSSNWSDLTSVSLSGDQRTRNPISFQGKINTGISRLIKKLSDLGYDLSGTNASGTSLYLNLLTPEVAMRLKTMLIKTMTPENLEEYKRQSTFYRIKGKQTPKSTISLLDPKPNIVYFVPNHRMTHRDDPEPGRESDSNYESNWNYFKPKIDEIIGDFVRNLVSRSRNKLNAEYWAQGAKDSSGQTITQQLYDHVRNNWKRMPQNGKEAILAIKNLVNNRINTITQGGILPRRLDSALKQLGVDFYEVYKRKGWRPLDAKAFIEKNYSRGGINDFVAAIKSL